MGKVAYHAGSYIDERDAVIPVSALAMRYGLSIFEGIRAYKSRSNSIVLFRLNQHIERLRNSLEVVGFPDPGIDELPVIIERLIVENSISDDCYIRPSIHAINDGDMGSTISPAMTVTIKQMGRKTWLKDNRLAKVATSSWRKASADIYPPALKCISAYTIPFVAGKIACSKGYDFPIFLSKEGYVSEAPTSAIFIVSKGELKTPSLENCLLPSITRQAVIDMADELNIPVNEESLTVQDLYLADEAFLCGTGLEFAPIESIDSYRLRQCVARPITRRVIDYYFEIVRS
ncbi:aminotransferase class IV [Advenella sp. S44]|uniref:aminotransferase class IV n=1 Tax=Advenella sp. S44 TaxID=1982755 RepID=UPI000C2A951A|nr:aminotransferase class IV [Advenella sp. S44]PJX27976.1 aminotransferase class IV [Advenella sp. S44]